MVSCPECLTPLVGNVLGRKGRTKLPEHFLKLPQRVSDVLHSPNVANQRGPCLTLTWHWPFEQVVSIYWCLIWKWQAYSVFRKTLILVQKKTLLKKGKIINEVFIAVKILLKVFKGFSCGLSYFGFRVQLLRIGCYHINTFYAESTFSMV